MTSFLAVINPFNESIIESTTIFGQNPTAITSNVFIVPLVIDLSSESEAFEDIGQDLYFSQEELDLLNFLVIKRQVIIAYAIIFILSWMWDYSNLIAKMFDRQKHKFN